MTTRADLHHAIIDVLDTGGTVPCVGDDRWLSSSPQDGAQAVKACGSCPVLAQCRTYSEQAGENAGVWAGKRRGHTGAGTYAGRGLTRDQKLDIDDLLAKGATAPAIAAELSVTVNQVNNYRYHSSDRPRVTS